MCKHVLVQELREVGYTHVVKNTKGATDTINPLDHHHHLPNLCLMTYFNLVHFRIFLALILAPDCGCFSVFSHLQIQSYPPLNGIQELDT